MTPKLKSLSERLKEMLEIYARLDNFELTDEVPGIKEFKIKANEFVKDGVSSSGKIKIALIKRTLEYVLAVREGTESFVNLKYTPWIADTGAILSNTNLKSIIKNIEAEAEAKESL